MKLQRSDDGSIVTVLLTGDMDNERSVELEKTLIEEQSDNISELVFDMSETRSIGPAGLRVLLTAQKLLREHDKDLVIKNPSDNVMSTLKVTGFAKLLNIA